MQLHLQSCRSKFDPRLIVTRLKIFSLRSRGSNYGIGKSFNFELFEQMIGIAKVYLFQGIKKSFPRTIKRTTTSTN